MGVNKRMLIQHRLFKDIINPKDILSLKDMVKLQATLNQPKHTRIMLLSLPIRQLSILSKHTQARLPAANVPNTATRIHSTSELWRCKPNIFSASGNLPSVRRTCSGCTSNSSAMSYYGFG